MCAIGRERSAWVAIGLGLVAVGPEARGAETLDRELLRLAPVVLRYLKDHHHANVGVLKFLVKKGDGRAGDRVGTINLSLATRLEIALVLSDDFKKPLGVIHDACAVAVTIADANHLTGPGRKALFQARYPLAWGDARVEPDAFLTGDAVLGPDLATMTVTIRAFGRDGAEPVEVTHFEAAVDAEALVEAGESFLLRGAFDDGRVVENAVKVDKALVSFPLSDRSHQPVTLEILYDGKQTPIEIKEGRAFVAEPTEGQAVTLVLRRTDPSDRRRYGVVLFVNGQSTLFKERGEAARCRMWVLGPDAPVAVIKGYQVSESKAESFRVLSAADSRRDAIDYGSDVGTIGLVVFGELPGDPEIDLTPHAENLAAISRGTFPERRPQNFGGLKFSLLEGGSSRASRGIIKEGDATRASVRPVEFHPESTPSMAATITYYRP